MYIAKIPNQLSLRTVATYMHTNICQYLKHHKKFFVIFCETILSPIRDFQRINSRKVLGKTKIFFASQLVDS